MLRAAVTAVRGVSFEPVHPLSGVYAGANLNMGLGLCTGIAPFLPSSFPAPPTHPNVEHEHQNHNHNDDLLVP